jgi:hypothetical protein
MTGGSTIPPGCRHCRSSAGTRSSAIERCRRYPGPHALALKFDPVGVVDSAQAQCCQNPTPASPQRNPRKTYQHRHQRPPKGAGNDPSHNHPAAQLGQQRPHVHDAMSAQRVRRVTQGSLLLTTRTASRRAAETTSLRSLLASPTPKNKNTSS